MARPAGIDVVRRAYELWEQAGKPEGRDQEFYLQAERRITGRISFVAQWPVLNLRVVGLSPSPGRPPRHYAIDFWFLVGRREDHKMENAAPAAKPETPRCSKCGKEPAFVIAVLDTAKDRKFRMYECKCGNRMWTWHKD
jgi:Protein of unknown function (DUF2934)